VQPEPDRSFKTSKFQKTGLKLEKTGCMWSFAVVQLVMTGWQPESGHGPVLTGQNQSQLVLLLYLEKMFENYNLEGWIGSWMFG
jgi:hypothetical protein